eukprot:scaffold285212_cov71-Attheya_sp.AAC.1
MASRYYETKEVTVSVIPRAKVTNTEIGILVYQGDSNEESQYAPSLLRKFMIFLKSAELRAKTQTATTRTQLVTTLAYAYGKQEWHGVLNSFVELKGKWCFADDPEWGDLLERLRLNECTPNDILILHSRIIIPIPK